MTVRLLRVYKESLVVYSGVCVYAGLVQAARDGAARSDAESHAGCRLLSTARPRRRRQTVARVEIDGPTFRAVSRPGLNASSQHAN